MHWKMWMWSCTLEEGAKTSRVWDKQADALGLTCKHPDIFLFWHVPAVQRSMSGTGVALDCPPPHPAPVPAWKPSPSVATGGVFWPKALAGEELFPCSPREKPTVPGKSLASKQHWPKPGVLTVIFVCLCCYHHPHLLPTSWATARSSSLLLLLPFLATFLAGAQLHLVLLMV